MMKFDLKPLLSYVPITLLLVGLIMLNLHQTFITYTATKKSTPITMTFSGIAKPLKNVNVSSPVDGTITQVTAKFGNTVKKGETLFYLQSTQLETTLRSTITNYLKAKSQLANVIFQQTGNTALYKAGLISKIDFMNSENQYQSAQVALWDANETLKTLLKGIGIEEDQIEKLSLNDIDKVKAIIAKATGQLQIISPIEGVLSTQNKVASLANSTDVNKEITPGTVVKQNDVVAIIYEMTGLSFTVDVSETQFHDISVGQKVSVTGVAFPSITLDGYVKSINHEANAGSELAKPTYTIHIIVPNITLKQRQLIEEGMSAEITLIKDQPPSIRVPIPALIHDNNGYIVKKISPVDGRIIDTPVTAGSTDISTVEIKSGLQEGDEIVIPD